MCNKELFKNFCESVVGETVCVEVTGQLVFLLPVGGIQASTFFC